MAATCPVVGAQEIPDPTTNNPFSRTGVGESAPRAFAAQLGMGGVGYGFTDPHIASPTNPAARGALRFTSFQVGLGLDRSVLTSGELENVNLDGNLDYLSLSFPLQNSLQRVLDGKQSKWRNGMQLGIAPFSSIGYDIELVSERPALGSVVNELQGSGGYYRLQWGNGVEYDGKWRGGVNLSFVFGRTNALQRITPSADLSGASVLTDTESFRGRGPEAQFGVQRDLKLSPSEAGVQRVLTIGVTYTVGTTLNGEGSRFVTTENDFFVIDTVTFRSDLNRSVELPSRIGLGAFYRQSSGLRIGVDVERIAWSDYRNSVRPDERLSDATRIAVGGEWIPDVQAFGRYWQRVRYRVGGYLTGDARPGVDAERGVTFGVGLPVVRPREEVSYVNLAVNAGRFGDEAGISQQYIRLTVGFTLTDNSWFYKRRFN